MEGDNCPSLLVTGGEIFLTSQHPLNNVHSTMPDLFFVIHGSILRQQKLVCWLDACAFHLFLFVLERLSRKEIFYAPLIQGNSSYFAENILAHRNAFVHLSISLYLVLKSVHI